MAGSKKIWEEYGVSESVWKATAGRPRRPKYANRPLPLESVVWASVLCEEALSDLESFEYPKYFDEAIDIGSECFGSERVAMSRVGRAVSIWMRSIPFEDALPKLRSYSKTIHRIVVIQVMRFAENMAYMTDVKKSIGRAVNFLENKYLTIAYERNEYLDEINEILLGMNALLESVSEKREEVEFADRRQGQQLYIDQSAISGAMQLFESTTRGSPAIGNVVEDLGEGYAMKEVHPSNGYEWKDFDEAQDYFEKVVIRQIATDALILL